MVIEYVFIERTSILGLHVVKNFRLPLLIRNTVFMNIKQVTMERDLCITRTLTLHPVLWKLLELLANKRPSLSYCSVIVR